MAGSERKPRTAVEEVPREVADAERRGRDEAATAGPAHPAPSRGTTDGPRGAPRRYWGGGPSGRD